MIFLDKSAFETYLDLQDLDSFCVNDLWHDIKTAEKNGFDDHKPVCADITVHKSIISQIFQKVNA